MNRKTFHRVTLALPPILFALIAIGTVVMLVTFLRTTWRTVNTAETLAILRQEVVAESLHRARFDRIVERLKKKMAPRAIQWEKLRDPF
ncbi:MAG: hypothetical protein UY81_C0030G0004 [Candidatus Giovannonibacteria bacterium GW2011_GWA2_53_7]|uniref:Uncharacterized protein n=1 Tax=Candidatus Giovannonibacteria bacterium GW2011_GWA2_53_7 TaxID=1618650 RepID=A0A0G1XZJ1_9BACT|nr:MAG: hypothetical protein UY81_C0030G0004 [Candidatus Giovannonibacteria bacterium GW2011_GWA2_53_7]